MAVIAYEGAAEEWILLAEALYVWVDAAGKVAGRIGNRSCAERMVAVAEIGTGELQKNNEKIPSVYARVLTL